MPPLRKTFGSIMLLAGLLSFSRVGYTEAIHDTGVTTTQASIRFCYFKWSPYGNDQAISNPSTGASHITQDSSQDSTQGNSQDNSQDKTPHNISEHQGIAIDIIRHVGARLGITVEFQQVPYKRCMAQVVSGYFAGIAYYVPNNHQTIIPLSESFMGHLATFFVQQQSSHQHYKDLQQFSNQTIAVLRGGSSVTWLGQNKDINLYRVNRQDYLWQMIRGQRVDASIDDYVTFIATGKNLTRNVRALLPPARYAATYIGFNQQLSKQVMRWNKIIATLKKDGTIKAVYQKHLGDKYQELLQYHPQITGN